MSGKYIVVSLTSEYGYYLSGDKFWPSLESAAKYNRDEAEKLAAHWKTHWETNPFPPGLIIYDVIVVEV